MAENKQLISDLASSLIGTSNLKTLHFGVAYRWVLVPECVEIICTNAWRFRRLKRLSVAITVRKSAMRLGRKCRNLILKLDMELEVMGFGRGRCQVRNLPEKYREITWVWNKLK